VCACVCELHCLRQPTGEEEEAPAGGEWVLCRWMDYRGMD
jgi:hypothetical protein